LRADSAKRRVGAGFGAKKTYFPVEEAGEQRNSIREQPTPTLVPVRASARQPDILLQRPPSGSVTAVGLGRLHQESDMFGLKRAPHGTDGDSVSPRRDKLVVAVLTLALGAGLAVSTLRQGDHGARIRALQARVDQLNAKQAAARKRVKVVTERYPGDPQVFEISRRAGWLTPEEWAEWQRLQDEIDDLGGTASWEIGTRRVHLHAEAKSGSAGKPVDPTHPRATASTYEVRD
jgi:hypothetical protein